MYFCIILEESTERGEDEMDIIRMKMRRRFR